MSIESTDLGLRNSQIDEGEFIRRYCEVFRPHAYATEDSNVNEFEKVIRHVLNVAYATEDGNLNEFEKLITHVLNVKMSYDRIFELLGIKGVYLGDAAELLESDSEGIETVDDRFLELKTLADEIKRKLEMVLESSEKGAVYEGDELDGLAKLVLLKGLFA